jgi:hypothetical protein
MSGCPKGELLFTTPDNVKRIILRKKIRCYIINIFTFEADMQRFVQKTLSMTGSRAYFSPRRHNLATACIISWSMLFFLQFKEGSGAAVKNTTGDWTSWAPIFQCSGHVLLPFSRREKGSFFTRRKEMGK